MSNGYRYGTCSVCGEDIPAAELADGEDGGMSITHYQRRVRMYSRFARKHEVMGNIEGRDRWLAKADVALAEIREMSREQAA